MSKRNTSSKDNHQERCMCFIRRHNRTQSVPWVVHRQHQSYSGACGTSWFSTLVFCILPNNNDISHQNDILHDILLTVYNKWGTELTRKSYSHLTTLYNNRNNKHDLTKSVLTFDCDTVENQLKTSATPDQLREWWGYFLDIEDIGAVGGNSTPPRSLEDEVYCYTESLAFSGGWKRDIDYWWDGLWKGLE